MCSYNAVNGVPSCANEPLLNGQARGKWGFDGYITSDCGAVNDVYANHKYTNTTDATVVDVLTAGMDSDCGGFLNDHLVAALADGTVTKKMIDTALTNMFRVRMRLGQFDPDSMQPYKNISTKEINTPAHQQLALDAARQGIVLLKNNNNTLPLAASNVHTVAVVGPNGNATTVMQGNYQGVAPYLISPTAGISKYATATYTKGCDINSKDTSGIPAAVSAAAHADAVVVVVGLDQTQEAEGRDRTDLSLPGQQNALVEQVCAVAKGPVVVVVMSGGSVDLSDVKNNNNVHSILWVGYPGQSGGTAIAETLFGDNNPSGRLTQTFYPSNFTSAVSMFDMGMHPNKTSGNPGRGYRFYTGTPIYPFGTGLSYTTFVYKIFDSVDITLKSSMINEAVQMYEHEPHKAPALLTIDVIINNNGSRDGSDSVLVFVSAPAAGGSGHRRLCAYERVHLKAGGGTGVSFPLSVNSFATVGEDGSRGTTVGDWVVHVGDSQRIVHVV